MRSAPTPQQIDSSKFRKGYFPHLLNKSQNFNYSGSIPDTSYYDPDSMSPEARSKFLQWHQEQIHLNTTFDFQKELVDYCISDVELLAEASFKFRNCFFYKFPMDVVHFKTPSSFSLCESVSVKILKVEHYCPYPHEGFHAAKPYSDDALKWLAWESHQRGVAIDHALNTGECKIDKYYVDGFDEENRTVFEFNGCYTYGHPKCFSNPNQKFYNSNVIQGERFHQTLQKAQDLDMKGFSVETKWECEFKRDLQSNPTMKEFVDKLEILKPLEPQHGYYGGRVEGTTLYHDCSSKEEIKYTDIVSLYPYVLKYGLYPLNLPEIL